MRVFIPTSPIKLSFSPRLEVGAIFWGWSFWALCVMRWYNIPRNLIVLRKNIVAERMVSLTKFLLAHQHDFADDSFIDPKLAHGIAEFLFS